MIGKSHNFIVKVPEGMIKQSNSNGTTHLIKLWYNLKSNKNSGHYITLKEIQDCTNESFSSIYKKITKMIELKWINKDSNGFKLISYDKLFKLLGYNMAIKKCKKGFRAGTFKIFKIAIQNFLENIYIEEIKLNFQKQKYRVRKKLTQKRVKVDTTNRVNKDITLSVRGVSRILGYKSASTGYKIEKQLEKSKLITIIRRPILYNYSLPNLLII